MKVFGDLDRLLFPVCFLVHATMFSTGEKGTQGLFSTFFTFSLDSLFASDNLTL